MGIRLTGEPAKRAHTRELLLEAGRKHSAHHVRSSGVERDPKSKLRVRRVMGSIYEQDSFEEFRQAGMRNIFCI
jgi:hypothetical protein